MTPVSGSTNDDKEGRDVAAVDGRGGPRGLLNRARAKRSAEDEQATAQQQQSDRADRLNIVREARRILGLDPEELTADDLRNVHPERFGHNRSLFEFDYDGLHFLVGRYWHGNPGDSLFFAVQVKKVRGRVAWPPDHARSASNTRWAPDGYKAVYSLAQLARVIDGDS